MNAEPDDADVVDLFAAIRDGVEARVVELLAKRRALVNARDTDGQTPLHAAAFYNDARIGAMLVDAGADPNAVYIHSGHTALSWAVTCRALDFAATMVRMGHEADLFCAAGMGWSERVAALFDEAGALTPNASRTGSTRMAADGSRLPCPPPTAREQVSDALYIAARNGLAPVVRFLLTRNPDLSFRAYLGGTPLHWAHFGGSSEIVGLLLQAGADDTMRDDALGTTPRAFGICTPANWGFDELVQRNLARDPTLAHVLDGTSPLHEAARGGHLSVVRMLLETGADPARQNRDGRTPGELAAEKGHTAVVEVLTTGIQRPPT